MIRNEKKIKSRSEKQIMERKRQAPQVIKLGWDKTGKENLASKIIGKEQKKTIKIKRSIQVENVQRQNGES